MAERARKYHLTIHYYPINHYLKKNQFHFVSAGIIKGPPNNVRQCLSELKRLNWVRNGRRVVDLESSRNTFICVTAHKLGAENRKFVRFFYNPGIIHLKPAVIFPDGHEEWEVCAFKRKHLDRIIKFGERLYGLQIISLQRSRVSTLHIIAAAPQLSERQQSAVELALQNGYYAYPRRTGLRELAANTTLSLSTFQAHLRKAENQLIPFLFGRC